MSRWWTRALAALSVALTIASVEAAERFSGITVFGDSLSDSGQFAGVGGPAGTFTNPDTDGSPGAIYLARLSDRYGFALAPTTPLIGSAAPGANNYAVGGYVTDEVLASIVSESRVQIGSLLATRPGYLVENPVADRRRLYVAWAGGNDIRRALDPDTQADNILASIQALHDAGARYILVNRLPDIGAVPESTFLGPSSVQSRSAASEQFNARLDAGIAAGAANVVYTDVTGFLGETQAEPVSFGLAPVDHRQVCYEAPGFPFTQCNVDPTYGSGGAQDNPDLMLFYDGIHPTQEGHRRLGEYIVSVLEAPTLISSLAEVPLASARAHQRSLESQMEQPVASNGWRSFAAGSYGRLEADADGLAPGWDQSGYALDLGAVYGYGNGWQSGIGLGISGEEVDFAADRGGFDLRSYYLSAFGGYRGDTWFINAGASYGWLNYDDVQRRIAICDGCRRERGETSGDQWLVTVSTGAEFPLGNGWQAGPLGGLEHQRIKVDGYDEDGTVRSTTMYFGAQERDSTIARLGAFARYRSAANRPLSFTAALTREQELDDDDRDVEAGLRSLPTGTSFELPAVFPEGGAWVLALALSKEVAPGVRLGGNYRFANGDDYTRENWLSLDVAFDW